MNRQDIEDFWASVEPPTEMLNRLDPHLPGGINENNSYFDMPNADGARKQYIVVDANGKNVSGEPETEREAYESMKVLREHAREGNYTTPLRVERLKA